MRLRDEMRENIVNSNINFLLNYVCHYIRGKINSTAKNFKKHRFLGVANAQNKTIKPLSVKKKKEKSEFGMSRERKVFTFLFLECR